MRWKLSLLAAATLAAIVMTLPIRTHAVLYRPGVEAPPETSLSFRGLIENVHLTPGTAVWICALLLIATAIALRIIHSG